MAVAGSPIKRGTLVRVTRRSWGTPDVRVGDVRELVAVWDLKPHEGSYAAPARVAYELMKPGGSKSSDLITGQVRPLTEDEQAAYSLGGAAAVECLPVRGDF